MSIEETIRSKLAEALCPTFLEVVNESHGHNVAKGAETHFKIIVASTLFDGVRAVARHQKLYALLSEELAGGVHALALHTYTPVEWQAQMAAPESPACMGGAKR